MSKKANTEGLDNDLLEVIEAGVRILAYAANTEKQLRIKLKRKDFDLDLIDQAIEYFIDKGYLDDYAYMERMVENLANRKLYGMTRIKTELHRMGFSYVLIQEISYDGIDFIANCAKVLRKRGGEFNDKTVMALRRYGYNGSEIKAAYKLLKDEDN